MASRQGFRSASVGSEADFDLHAATPTPAPRLSRTLLLSVLLSVALQMVSAAVFVWGPNVPTKENVHFDQTTIIALAVLQSLQLILTVRSGYLLLRSIWTASLICSVYMFLCTLLCMMGLYTLLYAGFDDAFMHTSLIPSYDASTAGFSPVNMLGVLLYFSVSTQTLVGFGDVSPRHPITQIVAGAHMVVGVVFSLFILSQTVKQLTPKKKRRKHRTGWWATVVFRNKTVKKTRRWLRRNLFVVSLVCQAVVVVILYAVHPRIGTQFEAEVPLLSFGFVSEAIQLSIIITTSYKFLRKPNQLSIQFLFSTYGATILVFGVTYLLLFLTDRDRGFYLPNSVSYGDGQISLGQLTLQLLYFSVAATTTAGFGDTFASNLPSRLMVSLQLLLSLVFHVLIFGVGMAHIRRKQRSMEVLRQESASLHHRITRSKSGRLGGASPSLLPSTPLSPPNTAAITSPTSDPSTPAGALPPLDPLPSSRWYNTFEDSDV